MQIAIHLVKREPIPRVPNGAIISSSVLNNEQSDQSCSSSGQLEFESRPSSSQPSYHHLIMNTRSSYKQHSLSDPDDSKNQRTLTSRVMEMVPIADQSSFKTAFYTVVLLVLALMLCVGLWCVYHLLFAFLKPMLWAVLAGTAMFPLKLSVTNTCRGWLRNLRTSNTPLVVGVACLPFSWLDALSEQVWRIITTKLLFYVVGMFAFIKIMTYEDVFMKVIRCCATVHNAVDNVIGLFSSNMIVPVLVAYFCIYIGWLYLHSRRDERPNKKLARVLSLPIWFLLLTIASSYTGPFRVVVFVASSVAIALLAAGAIAYDSDTPEQTTTSVQHVHVHEDHSHLGDLYLQAIMGACALVFTAKHTWVLTVLLVPLMFAIIKKTAGQLSIRERVSAFLCGDSQQPENSETPAGTVKRLYDIAVPHTLRDFAKFIFSGDQKIILGLESSMDLMSSVIVIIALVIGMLFATLFVVFQLHSETVHLVRLSTNVFTEVRNSNWMSAAANFTEQKLGAEDVDEYMEQAYTQGRAWLAAQVRTLADAKDPERADLLEEQVKLFVDNLYEMWENRDETHVEDFDKPHKDLWTHLSQATNMKALKEEITAIIQENVGTLLAVAESVWAVLASNLTIVTSILAGLVGLLLAFSMELLNFFIELVVFFTMLFYLLVFSGDQFKPMEMLSRLSIRADGGAYSPTGSQKSVTSAIEESISGVFLLSVKMATFYGLYTWFIHNLFGLNIVFAPSVLACVLAAVPITSPPFVCLIGVAELFLVRGETAAAIVFFLGSLAPLGFADAAFYDEVKGSHPYITGLAIVGGMYWLGLEGAIIGPILLCCVLAVFNVYTSVLTN